MKRARHLDWSSSSSGPTFSLLSVTSQRARQLWRRWHQGAGLQCHSQWHLASLCVTCLTLPLNFSFLSQIFNKLFYDTLQRSVLSFILVFLLMLEAQEKRNALNEPLLYVMYLTQEQTTVTSAQKLFKTEKSCWKQELKYSESQYVFKQWKVSVAWKEYEITSELENMG